MKINELKAVWCWWLWRFVEQNILRAMSEQLNVFVMRNEEADTARQMLALLF
jgi:hypothetical protein